LLLDIDNTEVVAVMHEEDFDNKVLRFSNYCSLDSPKMVTNIELTNEDYEELIEYFTTHREEISNLLYDNYMYNELGVSEDDFTITKIKILWTNLRALVNAGIDYDLIPYNSEISKMLLKTYFIAKLTVPYFSFAQLRTHGQLSQVAVSERYAVENEVWLPDDLIDRIKTTDVKLRASKWIKDLVTKSSNDNTDEVEILLDLREILVNDLTIPEVKSFLKELGYHKEIYNRWYNHMKFKSFIIGGYLHDPYQWGHFLLERNAFPELGIGSGTQEVTAKAVRKLRDLIENYNTKD